MDGQNLTQLLESARGGDRIAEERLFARLSVRFRLFVRRRIGKEEDVEDVVQETLTTIYRKYRTATFRVNFTVWAQTVLNHRILAYYQKKKQTDKRISHLSVEETMPRTNLYSPDPDLKRRLLLCLRKIGAFNITYARALNLRSQGYLTMEICRNLHMRRGNFYTVLSRARKMLKGCLRRGISNERLRQSTI